MAYVSLAWLNVEHFAPLQDCRVTLYPPTDASFTTFPFFEDLVDTVRKRYRMNIAVATVLENYATDEQKARGIDLLEFILESEGPPQPSPREGEEK